MTGAGILPSGDTPDGSIGYGTLEAFSGQSGADFIIALVNQITAAATGYTNLQDALEAIASQIGFPEFADLLLSAFEGIVGSVLDFLPWFINLTDFLGFDFSIDPADFNPIELAIDFITHLLSLLPLDLSDIPIFGDLFDIFGGATGTSGVADFFTDLFGVFGGATGISGITDFFDEFFGAFGGASGTSGVADFLTDLLGVFGGATDPAGVGSFLSGLDVTDLLNKLFDGFTGGSGATGKTPTDVLSAVTALFTTGIGGSLASSVTSGFQNIFNNWFPSGGATGTPAEVATAVAAIRASIAGGYTLQTFTSSNASWSVPLGLATASEAYVGVVGGGGKGGNGVAVNGNSPSTAAGGAGGTSGGFLSIKFDPSTLGATEAVVVGAAASTAGANGGLSSFGSIITSAVNGNGIASPSGYQYTTSMPGAGGAGGSTVSGTSQTDGTKGGDAAVAPGGPGGVAPAVTAGNRTGGNGTAGTAGNTASTPVCGGGGGGGGGSARSTGVSALAVGGNGGGGGFPGGGSGGGGAGNNGGGLSGSTGGTAGTPGNGLVFLIWR